MAMLTLSLENPRAGNIAFAVLVDERKIVSQAILEVSQATAWMISVRDKRDRAAFSALFDFFAPKLKGFVMRAGMTPQQAEEIVQDASQIVAIEREAGELKMALALLKDEQREVIEKAYLGELTHQEISTLTGLPLGTIKSRIRLGLDKLRHELKELKP